MELKHVGLIKNEELRMLLIVPYGIETFHASAQERPYFSFNRTLWN